ncbi:Starch-binding associating with outer membrane [Chryseobacterium soldanellicola]|uniref:Starch-binding associating with outer membrane n=1 Tax=Chryseobacterium soldanellicola TaxID=311333 RepID=A0A1H1DT26_9FLAO|nr:SusD/RagB family nutrient-binding outer membrane lipoprotein [Chryseobacterium soldanellicola]SDQ79682.1 Starch-binding associating with outer membrane [Chryseobacterium soldanellicola]
MKKIIIGTLFSALLFNSCNIDDSINTDPNVAYTTTAESVISSAQKSLSDYVNTPSVNENNFRLTMQYWQETTYVNESNYDFVNRNVSNTIWSDNYVAVLNNLNQAKGLVENYIPSASEISTWSVTKKNKLAIIDLLMVYTYQNLVDTFGNIPYSQALQLDAHPLPVYDDGATIYTSLIQKAKADVQSLTTGSSFGVADYYYQGDISKWKKFGNSLLLKLGVAIADSNPTLAQATVIDAIATGVMTSTADNCQLPYQKTSPNYNPLYDALVASGRDDYIAAAPFVNFLIVNSDPRISSYYQLNEDDEYVGQTVGAPGEVDVYSRIGEFAHKPDYPGTIMNYTEVAFYLAEAAARWNTSTPATAYATAVQASMNEWGVSNANITTYLAVHPYNSANWKQSIGLQAWAAFFNQGQTSWNFYRRLDYPVLQAPTTAAQEAGGKVPVRMTYPVREQSVNGTNWAAASSAIGGDKLTTKLFWDKF